MESSAYKWLVSQYRFVLNRMRVHNFLEEHPQVTVAQRGATGRANPHAAARLRLEQLENRTMLAINAPGIGTWVEQGPAPITGGQVLMGPNHEVTGAISAIAATGASTLYVGTVGGGIWRTNNATVAAPAQPTWVALTDQLPSNAITAIAVDPVNPQIVWAGTGRASNSFMGGKTVGLMRSADGGTTWSIFDASLGTRQRTVYQVVPTSVAQGTGRVVLVASEATPFGAGPNQLGGGLLRSRSNGGANGVFDKISGNANDGIDNDKDGLVDDLDVTEQTGLPGGSVTDLKQDPLNVNRFYAAVAGQGIFRSDDAGLSWIPVNTGINNLAQAAKIELGISALATASGHAAVYAALLTPVSDALTTAIPAVGATNQITVAGDAPFEVGDTITIAPGTANAESFPITRIQRGAPNTTITLGRTAASPGGIPANARAIGTPVAVGSKGSLTTAAAASGATTIKVRSVGRFLAGEVVTITNAAGNTDTLTVLRVVHGGGGISTLQLSGALTSAYAAGSFVSAPTINTMRLRRVYRANNLPAVTAPGVAPAVNANWTAMQLVTSTDQINFDANMDGTFAATAAEVVQQTFGTNPGGQGNNNFAITVDPANPDIVWVSGDVQPTVTQRNLNADGDFTDVGVFPGINEVYNSAGLTNFVARIFRGDFAAGTQWGQRVGNTVNNTAPHADSRVLTFAHGRLLESDDGGINRFDVAGNRWHSINGNMGLTELYSVALNPANNILMGGAQDVGTAIQSVAPPGANFTTWNTPLLANGNGAQADGGIVQVGVVTGNVSRLFYSTQSLGGFTMSIGGVRTAPALNIAGTAPVRTLTGYDRVQFIQPYVVNNVPAANNAAPTPLLFGTGSGRGGFLYESTAGTATGSSLTLLGVRGGAANPAAGAAPPAVADIGIINAMIYGGFQAGAAQADFVLAGSNGSSNNRSQLYIRQPNAGANFNQPVQAVVTWRSKVNRPVRAVATDPGDWRRIFVLDDLGRVWFTANGDRNPATAAGAGAWQWTQITSNLKKLPGGTNLQKIAVFTAAAGGTPSVLVGGEGGLFRRVGVAGGELWAEYGNGLPNALITDIEYHPAPRDVLVVSTLGRGSWAVSNAAATLVQPSNMTIDGSILNDLVQIRRNAQSPWLLDIWDTLVGLPLGAPTQQVPLASITSLTINGLAGNDEIVIDSSNGPIWLPGGITVNGGDNTDKLTFVRPVAGSPIRHTSNTGALTAGTGTNKVSGPDVFRDKGTQVVRWNDVETPTNNTGLGEVIDILAGGITDISDAFQGGLADVTSEESLAGLNLQSILAGLNGVQIRPLRPRDTPLAITSQAAPESLAQIDNATSLLRRLIEDGLGGFNLGEVGSDGVIINPGELEAMLEALDEVPNNVSFDDTLDLTTDADALADTKFDVKISKRLGGIVDLDIASQVFGGIASIELLGQIEMEAQVDIHLVFGVDANGFFLLPSGAGDPALRLSDFDIKGAASGSGRLGFLGVDLKDATLSVDDGVKVDFKLLDPGTDAADSIIRIPELTPDNFTDLLDAEVFGDVESGPDTPQDDVTLTGTFGVSLLLPDTPSGISLLDGNLTLSWENLADPSTVKVSAAAGSAGEKIRDFLNVTSAQVLQQLKDLRGYIDLLAQTPLKSGLPLLTNGLETIINVVEAIDSKLINPLSGGGGVNAGFFTAQELAVMLAGELGLDLADLNLSYNSVSGELTMHIDFQHAFASANKELAFEIGLNQGLAIDADFTGAVDGHFGFAFDLGVDIGGLTAGGDIEDNIFIRNASLDAGIGINILDLDVDGRLGFLNLQVVNGTVTADPQMTLNLIDPGTNAADGRIDLAELFGAPAAAIGSPAFTGSVILSLPLAAPFLGITASAGTTVGVTITFAPSGSGIAVTLPSGADWDDMFNFTNMDAASMAGLLGKLTFWLDEFRRSDEFKKLDLPLIGPVLDQVLGFADAFRDKVLIDDADDDVDGTTTLLNDINTALAKAGVGDKIRAENDGGKIRLIANHESTTFSVTASGPLGFGAQSSSKPGGAYFDTLLANSAIADAEGNLASKTSFDLVLNGDDPITVRLYKTTGPAPFDGATTPNAGTDRLTINGHGLASGDEVKYDAGGGTQIPGLTNGSTYFVIRIDANNIQLAKTLADATAATPVPVNITGVGAALHTLSHPYNTDDNTAIGNDKWKLVNADNAATFATVQEMIPKLGAIFGVPGLSYNKADDTLTFSLNLNETFGSRDFPINFNFDDLEPLLGLETSGSIRLSADGSLNLTVGVYLGAAPPSTKLTGDEKVTELNGGINIKTDDLITAPNDVKAEYGRLTADALFKVFINGDATGVDVTIPKSPLTDNNTTIADLIGDINARINATTLNGKVVAEADGLKVVLKGIGATTALKVTANSGNPAVREIGLPADNTAVAADGVLKITGREILPVSVGKLASNAVFNISVSSINGGASVPVTVNFGDTTTNRNLLDVIADVQKAIDAAVGAGKILVASSGRRLTFAATDPTASNFTITATAGNPAITVLGLAASNQGNADEFVITLRDGTKHGVSLDALAADPLSDLNDLMAAIIDQVGAANIDVQIDPAKEFGLKLMDKTSGSAMFKVEMVNGTTAAIDLGILKQDAPEPIEGVDTEDPDGIIDGDPIAGIKLTDRFFIQTANVNVGLHLSTPTNVTGKAKFGFVGIELDGGGSADASFTMGLKDPKTVADDGRITLTELIDNLGNISSFVAAPSLTGTGSFALDINVNPSLPGLDLGDDPQIVFTINTLGDPFFESTLKDANYAKVSNTQFTVDGDLTAKLPVGATINFTVPDGDSTEAFSVKIVSRNFAGGKTTVVVEPAEEGASTPLPSSLSVDGVSVSLSPDVDLTFPDLGDLLDFENLGFNFQTIIQGLKTLSEFLSQFEQFGFLSEPLPLVNVSVNDLIAVADKFGQAVEDAGNNPAGTIQLLEDKIKQAFGIPLTGPGTDLFNLLLVNDNNGTDGAGQTGDDFQILKMELSLNAAFDESLNLDFNLGDGISLGGAADLKAVGALDLDLDMGIRLDEPTDVYVFNTTGLTGSLDIAGTALSFNAAAGPLGIFIKNGHANINGTVDHDSNVGTAPKLFSANLSGATYVNGRTLVSDLDLDDDFVAQVGAAVDVELPVFFPTASIQTGTINFDATVGFNSTSGDFTLTGSPSAVDENGAPIGFGELFAFDPSKMSVLDGLLLGVDGVDLFLEGLQDLLDGELFGFELPLIGDKLSSAADVIGDFREGFVQDFRDAMEALANPAAAYQAFANSASAGAAGLAAAAGEPQPDPVSKILFELLGPTTGLGILKDGPDAGTDVSVRDIIFTTNISDPGVAPEDLFFDWDFKLGQVEEAGAGIGFDVGIPGLGLETTGAVDIDLGWELAMGFGINADDGFYVDVADQNELELTLDVTVPGGGIKGTLGFLQLSADDKGDTHLSATFGIDLFNESDETDANLGFTELGRIGIRAGLTAEALVDLHAKLALSSDLIPGAATNFPSIVADFRLEWDLDVPDITQLDGGFLENGLKFVGFENVGLDLGSYISDLVGPIVDKVKEITDPIKPFLDFLTTPIPVISDLAGPTTLLDIAALSGAINPGIIKSIEIIDQVVDIVDGLSGIGDDVILYFDSIFPDGTFVIYDSEAAGDAALPDLTDPNLDLSGLTENLSWLPGDLENVIGGFAQDVKDGLTKMRPGGAASGGFKLPIIEDPSQIFGMLMGQPAVLVEFDMAPLEVEADFSAFFSIFGPLGVSINAEFAALIDFSFGYDTQGVQDFAASGFRNPALLFNGFFVGDMDASGKVDVAELQFDAGLWAAAELNLGIARGGVGGGLFAEIDFNLHDPDHDGRVRISELVTNFLNEAREGEPLLAPLAIFDVTGSLTAKLFAFLKIDLGLFSIDEKFDITPPLELLNFNIPFTRVPTLATDAGGGVLQLNMGQFAEERIEGDKLDGDEEFTVTGNASELTVTALGFTQKYTTSGGWKKILAIGGEGNDTIDLAGVDGLVGFEVEGNAGDDEIIGGTTATGDGKFLGGGGNDTVTGGGGSDVIFGEAGDDEVHGGGGTDWLFGDGKPEDALQDGVVVIDPKANDGKDSIYGDAGTDLVIGGGGDDHLEGGTEADVILGDGGKATVNGSKIVTAVEDTVGNKGGKDSILAGAGDDLVHGGAGDDTIGGGDNADKIYGETGADSIAGDAGNDTVFAGTQNDSVDGGAGNDSIFGEEGHDTIGGGTEHDWMSGGTGSDVLSGDAGNDKAFGNSDPDTITGGLGNDFLEGGHSNDIVTGGANNDTLVAGYGSDTLDGETGNDSYNIASRGGSNIELTTAYDTGTVADTDILTVDGTAADDTFLLRAMADFYFPKPFDLEKLITNIITSGKPGIGDLLLEGITVKYGIHGVPDGMLDAVEAAYDPSKNNTQNINAVTAAINSNHVPETKALVHKKIEQIFEEITGTTAEAKANKKAAIAAAINALYSPNPLPAGMLADIDAEIDTDATDLDAAIAAFDGKFVNSASLGQDTAFVALINDGGAKVERFNYRNMEGLVLNTLHGNDYVASDDVAASATINLGLGNDRAQVGQVFTSQRDDNAISANIAPDDMFATVAITRGFLSNGISRPSVINGGDGNDEMTVFHNIAVLNLNGGDGDDLFTVRAFALAGSTDSERARTDMKGDGGADTIRYALNAPVGIDGGDGFDTIRVVGTEFSDDFVVTDNGVFGAGLNISYINIEKLIADGAEGNDRFFVMSTGLDVITEIDGGLGSDSFFVGGAPGNAPIPVISDDFKGHSGIILNNVESTDPAYQNTKAEGISTNIADDDEAYLIVTQTNGSSSVIEDVPGLDEDSYTIRLSRQPTAGVLVKLVDAGLPPEDQARKFKDLEFFDGTDWVSAQNHPGLTFSNVGTEWKTGKQVRFRAAADTASEGVRSTFINHVLVNSADPNFAQAQTLSVKVLIHDNDRAGVVISAADGNNTVLENGFSDNIDVVLTRQPTADVTVTLSTANNQLNLSDTTLTFTTSNWNTPQTVAVSAKDDTTVEGFHTDFITATVTSSDDGELISVPLAAVDADLLNDLVTEILPEKATSFVFLEHRPNLAEPVVIKLGGVTIQPLGEGEVTPEIRYQITGNTLTFVKNGNAAPVSGLVEASYFYDERGYDGMLVKDTAIDIYDSDAGMVIVRQSGGSTDVVEGDASSSDSYTVVLSKQPAPGTTVTIDAESIKTRNTRPVPGTTSAVTFVEQVHVNGALTKTLTFDASNWNVPQTVTVTAIQDTVVDGNETQVFAPELNTVNKIRGPLIIEGAAGAGSLSLPDPLMLPGELNVREKDGNVIAFTPNTGGGAIETMIVNKPDLEAALADVEVDSLAKLVGKTIELTGGPGTNVILDPARPRDLFDRFWLITELTDLGNGTVQLKLQNPTMVDPGQPNVTAPTTASEFAVTSLSVNFFVDERTSVDYTTVFDQDSVADDTGTLTSSDGNVLDFTPSGSDTETMLVETTDLQFLDLPNNDFNLLKDKVIEITIGPGKGRKWIVSAVANTLNSDVKQLTLTKVAGTGSEAPTNRSEFRVDGFDRRGRITGLGMGPNVIIGGGVQPGGITYGDMEVLSVNLGEGHDTVDVDYTTNAAGHTTKRSGAFYTLTMLNLGGGHDTVNAKIDALQDGDIAIRGQAGNDTINATGSTKGIVAFGEEGNDSITGGSGTDSLFGDFGRVDFVDAEGEIITRLGHSIPLNPVNPPVISAGADTITDPTANFTTEYGGLVGLMMQVISPDGHVQFRRIIANTADTLTLDRAFDEAPVTGNVDLTKNSSYRISALPEDQGDGTFRGPRIAWSVESGTGGDDVINAGDGNDLAVGGAGNDTIDAGAGSDVVGGDAIRVDYTPVTGNDGPTKVVKVTETGVATGNDVINAGADNDLVIAGLGNDTVNGQLGADVLVGDRADVIYKADGLTVDSIETTDRANGGDDRMYGNEGDDVLIGGTGSDALDGGSEKDLVLGDNVRLVNNVGSLDAIKGRFREVAGATMYNATTGAANVNAAAAHLVPAALRPAWADWTITLDQTLENFGNDYMAGGAGDDQMFGQLGNDTAQGDGSIDLVVSATQASVEAATDGDDYIEGNAGDDVIFGGLGQDDLIGGSSNLFSYTTAALRADGADVIFGGAGTDLDRNNLGDSGNTAHARDADFIVGDNGNVYRLVDSAGNYRTFTYDNYGGPIRLIPRSVQQLDYTAGGNAATDIGGADLVHGESGDDSVHGQVGDDVLFGEGQDDDIIGGIGHDRIYGGGGEDGILGDDGLIHTSRNGTTETLHGLTTVNAMTNITTPGTTTGAWIYITGRLNKAVKLLAYEQGGNDVMYGGLGDDFMHGGQGNDAISGAEATAAFYTTTPVADVTPIDYDPVTRKLAGWDALNPRAKIAGHLLNFDATDGGGVKIDDGKDNIFGDLGNDWLVGGTMNDRLFGGRGDDIMNADDNLDSPAGNDVPDAAAFADADFVYGGDGLDVLIGNTGKDRLYDWSGEFNSFFVPFSQFGAPTVNRLIMPGVPEFLLALGAASGADRSRTEPNGELGLFRQGDPLWNQNTGSPRDPQPGTTKAKMDTAGGREDDRNTALPL